MEYVFTEDNFESEVLNSDVPVLVDFFATWCGPCKMMAPVVEELAAEFEGKAKIGKLDIDDNMSIARKFRVMSVPTMLFFKNGKVAAQQIGATDKEVLVDKLNGLF